MNTPKLPPLPEREAFEAWMQGDATISLEKDGHGYVDMTAELMWHAWKARAAIEAKGVLDGVVLQIDAAVTQAQKVLSDWNEWYGMHGEKSPLPPGGIVKAQELLSVARSLLASASPAPQAAIAAHGVPDGWRKDVQKVRDSLDADDWCGDERMVDVLDRALGTSCCVNYSAGTSCFSDPKPNCPLLASAPPAPQASGYGPKLMPQVSGFEQSAVVQQEPVMIYHGDCVIDCGEHGHNNVELLKMIPAGSLLYTHPAQQSKPQPLSDEQRSAIVAKWKGGNWTAGDIIDAVEAAHGIKE